MRSNYVSDFVVGDEYSSDVLFSQGFADFVCGTFSSGSDLFAMVDFFCPVMF